ncbi:G-patch domain and KOW motifs-containing protein [Clinocottus analis]|uniref:G-patch domain and KOW motifs-containing protein n=1 Tax=Clinocottus analis TaxID=304258 RepID=UPI0035C249D7
MASHGEEAGSPKSAPSGDQEERKPAAVSFGFTKTVNKFKSSSGDVIKKDDRDYLTGIDGKELQSSKPSEKPKELIIPLIQKNRWHRPDRAAQGPEGEASGGKAPKTTEDNDSVESQAVKELIEDSRRQLELWKNGQTEINPNLFIPLLMQNKVPDGFEDGDHVKVDLRPESSTDADYESIPVEAYGIAMLKGMGWNKEEGIGRTFKQHVAPIEHQLRPRGLGLGADRSSIKDLEPTRHKRPPKPGDEKEKEEELVMGPGGCVLVESGAHKELYGKIEGLDADNARVVVKLAIGGKSATISQHAIKLVGRKEYDKNCKDLSRLSKAHKEKEKEQHRREEKERQSNNADEGKHKSSERGKGSDDRKRKHRESSQDREKPPVKEARRPPAPRSWLQRDLKVRFVDKAFKGGRYYNSKMHVEDVLTSNICVCRTEEGRLLDDVKQDMLETIIPKSENDSIMVVLGEHRGQVGRILQRDKNKCRAMVQLDRHDEKVFTLDYDTICQYVGATD